MQAFHSRFLELAKKEGRSLHWQSDDGPIPRGDYLLMEAYCTDPKCDCRRVMLTVVNTATGELAATIGFGFDPGAPMSAPMLDPLNQQSPYAEEMLRLVVGMALDAEYLARLERRYHMMKAAVSGGGEEQPRWGKSKPKKPTKPKRPERPKKRDQRKGGGWDPASA
jgi:hypothetical protein